MKYFLTCSLTLLLFSCSQKNALDVLDEPLIIGKATPVQLDLERTIVPLQDYVLEVERIDSITSDGPFLIEIDNTNLIIFGRPKKPLYTLTFWSEGVGESVLLKRTKKSLFSFFYTGDAREVKIKGDFNAWNPNNTVLTKDGNKFTSHVLLSPGYYQYLFVVDGEEIRDPFSNDSVSNGMGGWNSVITIPTPERGKLPIIKSTSYTNTTISLASSNSIDQVFGFWENTYLPKESVNVEDQVMTIKIPANADDAERSKIRLWAVNEEGISNDVLIHLHNGKVILSSD
jgi:hypothetical protein